MVCSIPAGMDRRAGRRAALSFLWFQDFAIHGFCRLVLSPWRRIVVVVRRQPMVFRTRPGVDRRWVNAQLERVLSVGQSRVPGAGGVPFSLFKHLQYAGTLLSIWRFFLVVRFPHDDWYLLPLLETGYYTLSAYFER